jgi:hypothetical protein
MEKSPGFAFRERQTANQSSHRNYTDRGQTIAAAVGEFGYFGVKSGSTGSRSERSLPTAEVNFRFSWYRITATQITPTPKNQPGKPETCSQASA